MALKKRFQPPAHDFQSKHLTRVRLGKLKGLIKRCLGITETGDTRQSILLEQLRGPILTSLVNERQLRSGRFNGSSLLRQISQSFTAEQSTKVAKKYQKHRPGPGQFRQVPAMLIQHILQGLCKIGIGYIRM
jgi:hypothetical protein